jgi:hypothetical protein
MLAWIGLSLLSISWLLGLGYYHAPSWTAWSLTIIAGTVLLGTASRGKEPMRSPGWKALAVALAMTVPAIWLMRWPDRSAPGLLGIGLGLALAAAATIAPLRRRLEAAAGTCLMAGCVLLSQSLAMELYAIETSRSHALPGPLPRIVAAAARGLGIDAAAHDSTVAVFSMRKIHLFNAGWEMFLDPPTWCFLAGGIVLLWWKTAGVRSSASRKREPRRFPSAALKFLLLIALWLPFRAAILIAVYLDNVLRTDYDAPLEAMKVFWNPWVLLAMLAGPVMLAWRFALPCARGEPQASAAEPLASCLRGNAALRHATHATHATQSVLSVALVLAGVALAGLGVYWDPVGARKGGRVLIEEYHHGEDDLWERTDKPFDTAWYGNMSGYNYYCIFDYCGHYYHVARLTRPIDDAALQDCDVLVLKIPKHRTYAPAEIDAITRFVERGGGLMMIGEHTDVWGSGTALNSVAEKFGFSFRFDCLFGIDSFFKEHYDPPLVPHPMIQDMPSLDFAISCSIDPNPGTADASSGRTVIRNAGLKNLTADYHADNYYPQAEDSAEMHYGAFIQLWAARHGAGRVAAFTDSTVFSNFCTFEKGKAELMMGMIEWLNHQGGAKNSRLWLLAAGAVVLLLGLGMARGWSAAWLLLVAGGLAGWSAAVVGSRALHRYEMPPSPRERPLVQWVVDRTLCDGPLSDAGFIEGKDDGFGIFERWILRLGYFTARRDGGDPAYFKGDAVVFLAPHLAMPHGFRERLVEYVRSGGKVLVVDSAGPVANLPVASQIGNPPHSTAGELLEPFGLAIDASDPVSGQLDSRGKLPSAAISRAATVTGGEPLAWVENKPVAARREFGDGSVTVVGFGSRFTDPNMGVTGDVVPDGELKAVYAVQFGLLRIIIEGKPK